MASRKNSKNGRKSSSKRARSEKKRKSHKKWHQKGCQSGGGLGGGLTGGGSSWTASAAQHQTAGSGAGLGSFNAGAGAGSQNHFALNSAISSPAQSSNHLMEKGILGGSRRRRYRRGSARHRKHRRYIGEQRGGYAEYLPEVANATVRGAVEVPANIFNSIQGASTAFKTSSPVVQPIGQPIQLA